MRPNPVIQRRQAHRKRLALGRALHQVRWNRGRFLGDHGAVFIRIPRILRKHARLLRRVWVGVVP